MSSNKFKLSTLAVLILGATQANAALYRVVEVPSSGVDAYGSAIELGSIESDTEGLGCFGTSCNEDDYQLAGDTRESYDGFSYRQEVPYGIDNRFYYQDQDDLESYCDNELGYSTCESWAENEWFGDEDNDVGGLYHEREAWDLGYFNSNASAFLQSDSIDSPDTDEPTGTSTISDSKNVVVNAISVYNDGSLTVIGNTSSGYFSNGSNALLKFRDRGFYGDTLLPPKQISEGAADIVEEMGRTMAFDSFELGGTVFVVGSGSVASFNYDDGDKDYAGDVGNCSDYGADAPLYEECQNFAFAMKPYVWAVTDSAGDALDSDSVTGISASLWSDIGEDDGDDDYDSANQDDYSAQGSIRAAVVPSDGSYADQPVLVGYNTDEYNSRLLMQAAVFYPDSVTDVDDVVENAWSYTFITDATVRIDGDYIYSNSVAKDINDNLLVIGEAKRYGSKPESGAANNRLFIADASSGSPTATYFTDGIFFSGAGGEANAINNYNEIVGQIDAESHREINGKQRRKRAFVYPYDDGDTSNSTRMDIFDNQAWWIDNLTNGGEYSSDNNQFRVINASDINDAGVISATALKCTVGEYDTTAHNSYCNGGSGDVEKIVAVKLIPIEGATSSDIEERSAESSTVTRQGGSIGWFALTLMTLISFRRKR